MTIWLNWIRGSSNLPTPIFLCRGQYTTESVFKNKPCIAPHLCPSFFLFSSSLLSKLLSLWLSAELAKHPHLTPQYSVFPQVLRLSAGSSLLPAFCFFLPFLGPPLMTFSGKTTFMLTYS